jgi:hypothetical protein
MNEERRNGNEQTEDGKNTWSGMGARTTVKVRYKGSLAVKTITELKSIMGTGCRTTKKK